MTFTSPTFLALVASAILLSNAFTSAKARSWVLAAASVAFIASQVSSWPQLVPLGLFMLLGYVSVELLRRFQVSWLLASLLALVLVSFVVLKRYSFLQGRLELPFPYLIAGLSYVLFRIIHLMVDARQGELDARIPPLAFFNYGASFLTFTAGPIQRYQDFSATSQAKPALDERVVYAATLRIVKGFVKVAVVSAALNYLFSSLSERLLAPSAPVGPAVAVLWAVTASTYAAYLYANFAGYMDIVLGVGRLMGMTLPENFNRPFAARNFLDFWARWHMTLSDWFKTYLFNPLLKALATRFDAGSKAPYLAVAAFFFTFLVMGLWHGTTSVFLVYGLLMGAGASINKLFQLVMNRALGKKGYKALSERPALAAFSRGLTFAYFALALSCLWLSLPELTRLARLVGPLGLLASYFGLAVASAIILSIVDAALARAARGRPQDLEPSRPLLQNLYLAAQILLIVSVGSFFHKAPEFVYRAF